MKKLAALSAIAVTMVATSTAYASTLRLPHKPFSKMTRTQKIHYLKRQKFHDKAIIRWQHNHSGFTGAEVRWAKKSLRIVLNNLRKLQHVASGAHTAILMCIHSHEGSWTDSGYPYWGGLQMDMNFQSAYGPEFLRRWGTADHWPVWAQLQAAERAIAVRGFSPWPNTAPLCGVA